MPEIIILLHNIRSIHNVGSIMRTAEGFGIKNIVFSGYTPHPKIINDNRLPHLITKIEKELHKTALGAEKMLSTSKISDVNSYLAEMKRNGYELLALEQSPSSVELRKYVPSQKIVLILGEEVDGISHSILEMADKIIEIPMRGQKESFNVSVAAGIAIYELTK